MSVLEQIKPSVEIITPHDTISVRVIKHLFGTKPEIYEIQAGLSIADIAEEYHPYPHRAVVSVNGHPIPRRIWHRVRPKTGTQLLFRTVPAGGGENGDSNKLARTLALVAIAIIAIVLIAINPAFAAAFAIGAIPGTTVLAAGVLLVGGLLVNLLLPVKASKGADAIEPSSPTSFIGGARNRIIPFGPVPVVLGKGRHVPPQGTRPFTETQGNDQYVRQTFIWGYGELQISDIKIGETPLGEFEEVEFETTFGLIGSPSDPELTLVTDNVFEDILNITLQPGPSATGSVRTTQLNADEISVDITYPAGIFRLDQSGDFRSTTSKVRIEYAVAGSGSYVLVENVSIDRKQTSAIRISRRWIVPRDQYDVRLTRLDSDNPSSNQSLERGATWTALRTITDENPFQFDQPISITAIRIRATDQLNGAIDQLNAIVEAIVPDWDSTYQVWIRRISRNPASLFRHVLQGEANARPIPDSRIDLDILQEWHEYCEAEGFEFNMVRDFRSSVRETLDDICAAGRATVTLVDGKWGVVIDKSKPTATALVTPNNSANYRGSKKYPQAFHGLRLRFINEDEGYQQDEILVFADGFDENNATKYEAIDLRGITNPDQAWKQGRFILANAVLRVEEHSFALDPEYLVFNRGDHIRLAHDVPKVGLTTSYVKEVVGDSNFTTSLILEQDVTFELGKNYVVRMRLSDNSQRLENVVNTGGETNIIQFQAPVALGDAAEPGDLVAFGESQLETLDLTVTSVEPGSNESAIITAVNYDEGLFTSDTDPIPPFNSKISDTAFTIFDQSPIVISIRSDESVLVRDPDGSLRSRILVILEKPKQDLTNLTNIQVQFRLDENDPDAWQDATPLQPVDVTEISIEDVITGETYEIRLRFLTNDIFGPWTTTFTQTVIGKTSAPPNILGLRVEEIGDLVYLKWDYPNRPLDFDHFEVRHRVGNLRQWDGAIQLPDNLIAENTANITSVPRGLRTFMVRGRDTSENLSDLVSLIRDLGDLPIDNVVVINSELALNWPGILDRGTIVSNELRADEAGGDLFLPNNDAVFLPDNDALFLPTTYQALTYRTFVIPPPTQEPLNVFVEVEGTFDLYDVHYRTNPETFLPDDSELFVNGAPDTDIFLAGPGTEVETGSCDLSATRNDALFDLDVEMVPEVIERLPDQSLNFNSLRMNYNYPTPAAIRRVVIPDNAAYSGMTNCTVMYWVKMRDFGDTTLFRRLLFKGPVGLPLNERMWYWSIDANTDGDLLYDHGDATTVVSLAAGTMTLETWHHLAVTKSGDDFVTYFDGSPVTTQTITGAITGTIHDLIARAEREDHWIIDELMIWDRTLSEDEIGFYSVRVPDVDDPNLIGFWPFCALGRDRSPFSEGTKIGREPIEFLITTPSGNIATTITDIKVTFDVQDRAEEFNDQAIPATPTTFEFSRPFTEIKAAVVQLQQDGGDAVNVEIIKKDPIQGVTLQAFDTNKNPTTANIDLSVRGY